MGMGHKRTSPKGLVGALFRSALLISRRWVQPSAPFQDRRHRDDRDGRYRDDRDRDGQNLGGTNYSLGENWSFSGLDHKKFSQEKELLKPKGTASRAPKGRFSRWAFEAATEDEILEMVGDFTLIREIALM